jgi:prepilin peptidase CpaA
LLDEEGKGQRKGKDKVIGTTFEELDKRLNIHFKGDLTVVIFLTVVLIIATINDIQFQRIPNWLTYPAMIVGTAYHSMVNGFEGFLFGVEGIVVGMVVFIIPYLMGGMGAGDIKLMGVVGGFLGPKEVFIAFLFAGIIGGIYALGILIFSGNLKFTVKRYWAMLKLFILTRNIMYIPPSPNEMNPRLCYGLAISLGTLLSLFRGSLI